MEARDSHIFPSKGALTQERKHQLQSRGNRKWRWHSSFVVFQPYIESLQLVNACHYSKETVARQLHSQKKKPLSAGIPKASFSSSVFWTRVCVLCCTNLMEQLPVAMLVAWSGANYPPPNTHRSAWTCLYPTLCFWQGRRVWGWWQPFPSSSAGGERKYTHPTLVTNCSNCTTEVFWKSILFKTWTSAIWLKWKHRLIRI